MAFNPLDAQAFVDALRGDDDEAPVLAAFKLTEDEQLGKSCIWPDAEYNDDLALASVIQDKLTELSSASVAVAFGTLIPQIVGYALQYLESLAIESDDGKTDSEPEQQSSEENASGA